MSNTILRTGENSQTKAYLLENENLVVDTVTPTLEQLRPN